MNVLQAYLHLIIEELSQQKQNSCGLYVLSRNRIVVLFCVFSLVNVHC